MKKIKNYTYSKKYLLFILLFCAFGFYCSLCRFNTILIINMVKAFRQCLVLKLFLDTITTTDMALEGLIIVAFVMEKVLHNYIINVFIPILPPFF